MIELKKLAENLQENLNLTLKADFEKSIFATDEVKRDFPNTEFRFRVVLDSSDYKAPERDGNKVIYYINAIMHVESSEVEGLNDDPTSYNASINTYVEFLIPMADMMSESGASVLIEATRAHLGVVCQSGISQDIEDENNSYLVGTYYTVASSGMRAVRERVGDSMTLQLSVSYIIIGYGVASNAFELYLADGSVSNRKVLYSSLSLARKTVSEMYFASNNDNYSGAKAVPLNTVLSIAITAPVRRSGVDELAADFLLNGRVDPFDLHLVVPNGIENGKTFKMVVDSVSFGAELNKAAAMSITFSEWQELNNA